MPAEPLPLREALVAVWKDARTPPPVPPKTAVPGEQWTYIWRSTLAAMLTWQGLAVYVAVIAVAALLT